MLSIRLIGAGMEMGKQRLKSGMRAWYEDGERGRK